MTKDMHWVVRSRSSDQNTQLGPDTPLWVIVKKLQQAHAIDLEVNRQFRTKGRIGACEAVAYLMQGSTYAIRLALRSMASTSDNPVVHFEYHFGSTAYQRKIGIQQRQLTHTGIKTDGELYSAVVGPYSCDRIYQSKLFVYKPEDKVAVESALKRHARRSQENRVAGVKPKYSVNFGINPITIGDVGFHAAPFIPLHMFEETWGSIVKQDDDSAFRAPFFIYCDSEEVRDHLTRVACLMAMSNAKSWDMSRTGLDKPSFVEKYETFKSIMDFVEPYDNMTRERSGPDAILEHFTKMPTKLTEILEPSASNAHNFVSFVKDNGAPWYYSVEDHAGYLKEDHHRVLFRSLYQ